MGVFQVIKASGSAIGPIITGYLVDMNLFLVVFEVYAGFRVIYEILLALVFWGYRTRAERAAEEDALNHMELEDSLEGSLEDKMHEEEV